MKKWHGNQRIVALVWLCLVACVGLWGAGCGIVIQQQSEPNTPGTPDAGTVQKDAGETTEPTATPDASVPTEPTVADAGPDASTEVIPEVAQDTPTPQDTAPINPGLGEKPQLSWHRRLGGEILSGGVATSAVLDHWGNVYVIGYFKEKIKVATSFLNSNGGSDIFVARYGINGRLEWVRTWGSTGNDKGLGIAVDKQDTLYIVGHFSASLTMDSHTIAPKGGRDAFVAQLTNQGKVLWVQQVGDANTFDPRAPYLSSFSHVAVNSKGQVIVAGGRGVRRDFNENVDQGQLFLYAYDSKGKEEWKREFFGAHLEKIYAMALDSNDNIGITGYSHRGIYFYPNNTLPGFRDYVVKFDSQGKALWIKQLPESATSGETQSFLKFDPSGNMIVAGAGDGKYIGEQNPPTSSANQWFVAKLDTDGKKLWAVDFLSARPLFFMKGLGFDDAGNIRVLGFVEENLTIDGTGVVLEPHFRGFFLTTLSADGKVGAKLFYANNDVTDSATIKALSSTILTATSRRPGGLIWVSSFRGSMRFSALQKFYSSQQVGAFAQEGSFFVAHIDRNDALQQVYASGNGTGEWKHRSMQRDDNGNLYVLAQATGNIAVNSGQDELPHQARVILSKMTPQGKTLWTFELPATEMATSKPMRLVVKGGYVYLLAHLNGEIFINRTVLSSSFGNQVPFVAKFDVTDGRFSWSRVFDSDEDFTVEALAVDVKGNLWIAGPVAPSIKLGGQTYKVGSAEVASYLARVSPQGDVQWVQILRGGISSVSTGICRIEGMQVDSKGNLYLIGQAQVKALQIGTFSLESVVRNGKPTPIGFVAKVSDAGLFAWAQSTWSSADVWEVRHHLALASDDRIFIAGSYSYRAVFGGFALPSTALADGFVALLDARGYAAWAQELSGGTSASRELIDSIAVTPEGGLDVFGRFESKIKLSPALTLSYTPVNEQDKLYNTHGFVARYNKSGETVWGFVLDHSKIASHVIVPNSIVTDAQGRVTLSGSFSAFGETPVLPDLSMKVDQNDVTFTTYNTDFLLSFVPPTR